MYINPINHLKFSGKFRSGQSTLHLTLSELAGPSFVWSDRLVLGPVLESADGWLENLWLQPFIRCNLPGNPWNEDVIWLSWYEAQNMCYCTSPTFWAVFEATGTPMKIPLTPLLIAATNHQPKSASIKWLAVCVGKVGPGYRWGHQLFPSKKLMTREKTTMRFFVEMMQVLLVQKRPSSWSYDILISKFWNVLENPSSNAFMLDGFLS